LPKIAFFRVRRRTGYARGNLALLRWGAYGHVRGLAESRIACRRFLILLAPAHISMSPKNIREKNENLEIGPLRGPFSLADLRQSQVTQVTEMGPCEYRIWVIYLDTRIYVHILTLIHVYTYIYYNSYTWFP
jgi:hypothetical protein